MGFGRVLPLSFRLMEFADLLKALNKVAPHLVVAVDPGETTGIAILQEGNLVREDFIGTGDAVAGTGAIWNWINKLVPGVPDFLVIEEYRVYSWKARSHSWSNLHTARLIGGLDVIASWKGIEVVKQSAQQAKGFCTDEKLKEWGFYSTNRHARDAIRHACYFAAFGKY